MSLIATIPALRASHEHAGNPPDVPGRHESDLLMMRWAIIRPINFYLRTAHIGEVAVGVWPPAMEEACARANIFLL
jgi:hypothetical protein